MARLYLAVFVGLFRMVRNLYGSESGAEYGTTALISISVMANVATLAIVWPELARSFPWILTTEFSLGLIGALLALQHFLFIGPSGEDLEEVALAASDREVLLGPTYFIGSILAMMAA